MKNSQLVGNERGEGALASTTLIARLFLVCAVLAMGTLSARATPPVLTLPGSVTVGEDGTTNVPVGVTDAGVLLFTVATTATSSDTNLVSDDNLVFIGLGTSRQLQIHPGLHQFGTATITVVAADSTSSVTNTFTLNVTFTNYAPIFLTSIGNQTNNEDTPSTNLSFSVYDIQSGESNLTFTATSSNTTLVPNANLVVSGTGSNRTLTITQATNQSGLTQISLVAANSGGASSTNTFLYSVWAVNQPPTATPLSTNLNYPEYAGLVTIPNFMTGISVGPGNPTNETLTWTYLYTTNFYTQGPSIDSSGTLTFQVVSNMSGSDSISFILTSSGSTTNGGQNTLTTVVTLNIGTNQPLPTFTLATNIVYVNEESGAVTNRGFVTSVNKGIAIEKNASYSFSISTVSSSPTNAAFKTLSLAANGNLTILPVAHSFGTNTVTVILTVNGKYPGWINTATNTFQIAVVPTNHAPTIVGAVNKAALENATNVTATINVWDYDKVSSNLVLTATSSNTSVATVSVTGTNVATPTNAVFTLTFTLGTNASGTVPIHLVATEGALSTTNNFTLTVTLVNQAPSFALSSGFVNVMEESPVRNFSNFVASVNKGPANQNTETYTYTVTTVTTNSTNATFQTLAIAPNGTLSVQPKPHVFGTNTVTVVIALSGGRANGGVNTATNVFQIGVAPTNHAPTIVGATNQTVLENAAGLTTKINVWDYDKMSTNYTLTATSMNTNLATVSIIATNVATATNVVYTLAYTLATNSSGVAAIQLVATEGAYSTTTNFNLTVSLVNQPASFALSTSLVNLTEESPAINFTNFVASVNLGPTNQDTETYKFAATTVTTNSTNAAFQALAVAPNGTLTVQPKAHTFGTNTVTLIMTLSGGNPKLGVNTATNTFQIAVAPTNHAPVIVGATNHTVLENSTNVLTAAINVWDYDTQSSNLVLAAASSNTNLATVSVTGTNVASATNAVFTLTFTTANNFNGTVPIQLIASEGALSTTNSFNLVVAAANKAPNFLLATNLFVLPEESGLQTYFGFVTGWKSSQVWSLITLPATGAANNAVFSAEPSVDNTGTLTFTPAAHSFGTNLVQVVMTDDTNFFTNTFQIDVAQIAHAPSLSFTNLTVLENGATTTNATTNTTITVSDIDAGTNFTITVTSSNTALVAATLGAVVTNAAASNSVNFTLNLALVTNASGTAPIILLTTESNIAGVATSTNTFTLTVTPVNQAPSYSFATNYVGTNNPPTLLVNEETAAVTNIGFLTNLSAGPSNEISQTWNFTNITTVTNNSTNAIFTALPAVDTNGNLTFAVLPHNFGTNLVTIIMTDNGGTNNGGVNTYTNSFLLEVAEIAHAPVIEGATNMTVFENGADGLTNSFTAWSYDEVTNFTFTATTTNSGLVSAITITTNGTSNGTNVLWSVAVTAVPNANGSATIQLIATEGSLTSTNTFTFTVTPVNQPPSYGFTTNYTQNTTNPVILVVGEDTPASTYVRFLTNMSAGPPNEVSQNWNFTNITTTTSDPSNAQFTVLPAISTNGTLSFTLAPHSCGTNVISIIMTDSGGTNNGGINTYSNGFSLQVPQTNHAPNIAFTNVTVFESAGTTNIPVNIWSYEASNIFTVVATSLSTNIVPTVTVTSNSSGPSNTLYTMAVTLSGTNYGTATIGLAAAEGPLSTSNYFTLTVTPVNQPPSYTFATNYVGTGALPTNSIWEESALAVTNVGFLTNLSAGPSNEISQTWNFTNITTVTNTANNVQFTVPPAVDTNGTLTYTLAPHRFGTNLVTIIMTDSGGTANGGSNTYSNAFYLAVQQTNHLPVIALTNLALGTFTNVTVLENASATNVPVLVWDYDQFSNFTFTATSLNPGLATVTWVTNSSGLSNTTYTLTITSIGDTNGTATIQLAAAEPPFSTNTNSFTFTITPVEQPPTNTVTTNGVTNGVLLVLENAGKVSFTNFLTNLSAGPAQASQTYSFTLTTVTTDPTNATFAAAAGPAIDTNGTLTFTTATNSFGTNIVTVVMTDRTNTTNGGINAFTNTFTLEVQQQYYPLIFVGLPTNVIFLENQSTNLSVSFSVYDPLSTNFTFAQSVSGASNIVDFAISGTNNAYTLLFKPATNFYGTNTITITAVDGAAGNPDGTNSFTIHVNIAFVDQPPYFAVSSNSVTVDNYEVAVSVPNALTNIHAGPNNAIENSQTVGFVVTNSNSSLFDVAPTISPSGTLSFTPGSQGGTVTVGFHALDNGNTNNGGLNTSTNGTLTIVIPPNAFQYLAGPAFTGLFYDTNNAANESSGFFDLALATNGTFKGYILCAGSSNYFSNQFDIANSQASVTSGNFALALTVDTSSSWTESITGSVSNTVSHTNSTLTSYLAGFSAANPTLLAGTYLMALPGLSAPTVGPEGDSIFSLTVSTNGSVSLTADMADTTMTNQTSQLSMNGYCPVYVALYDGGTNGSLVGWLNFTGALSNSVDPNSLLTWYNETGATTLYPLGFTNQALPLAALYNSAQSPLLSFTNGLLVLNGTDLATPITNAVTISNNIITTTNGLTLTISQSLGEITGSFTNAFGTNNSIYSVILQNTTNVVEGYYIGTNSGSFILYGH